MSVGGSVESDLVELSSFPVGVKISEPFVDLKVVKGNVGNDLLLESWRVSVVVDVVLKSESFELLISIKAILNWLRNLISELLDKVLKRNQVRNTSLSGLLKDFTNEDDQLMCGGIINAGDDGGGVGKFVLFEKSIEGLLKNFFVSESLGADYQSDDKS